MADDQANVDPVSDVEETDPTTWDKAGFATLADGSRNPAEPLGPQAGQHHYQLTVNPYEGTADLKKRDELDAEAVIAAVELELGTSGVIVQLFKTIDTDGSGELTIEDFEKVMGDEDQEEAAEKWDKLAKHFDEDSDGIVTLDEFRLGFKGFGIEAKLDTEIGFEAPYTWTVKQWIAELQSVLNRSVVDQCKAIGGWFSQFDGKMAEVRSAATQAEKEADTMLMVIYMNQATELQIHRLFELMDQDDNGVLEAADFAIMSKNSGTSNFWAQLKANFDANGDDCITFDEFKAHIASTVCERIEVGSIPRKDWTWRQVIGRLTEWSNRMVQEQCREIFDYMAHGEYGHTTNEDVAESGISANAVNFGCGSKLGDPAFPGGEPEPQYNNAGGQLIDAFGAPTAPDGSVPSTFRGAEAGWTEAAPQMAGMPPFIGMPPAPDFGPMGLPPAGPTGPTGPMAWGMMGAVFSLQQQMTQMDMEDVALIRARRDERYLQSLAVLGQFGMR